MFRRFFAGREAASPAAKLAGPETRRSRRRQPGLKDLEGRQLMSSLVHSPRLHVATFDTVHKAGSETTSGVTDLRYKFGTTFTTPSVT